MNRILKLIILVLITSGFPGCKSIPATMTLKSPNGRIILTVNTEAGNLMTSDLAYSLDFDGKNLMKASPISMTLSDGTTLGRRQANHEGFTIKNAKCCSVIENIDAPFYRQSSFTESYNELLLVCRENYSIRFRAFDSGFAYRFEIDLGDGKIEVVNEQSSFLFPEDAKSWTAYSRGEDLIANAFQSTYIHEAVSDFPSGDSDVALLPLAVETASGVKLLICESDLRSYPGMFLTGTEGGYKGLFAKLPDSLYITDYRCQKKVATREDIIARTEGTRTFPWRIVVVSDDDRQLPINNLVYTLAEPSRIPDASWIRPGQVAWEWWNDYGLRNVNFNPGVNNETYRAYIDFASQFGVEYVILDEGWSAKDDILTVKDCIDLPMLVKYAEDKGVGLIIWAVANILDDKLEDACAYYSELGIKGFKIDFIDRDDQESMDLIYRICNATAQHKLILDIHGVNKPAGLNRTFPNIVNFEGVYGMEELKWSNPDQPSYDVTFPFLRMVQGPVDYTAGAFVNATREGFEIDYSKPMSQGTRAHQVATYVVFDSPLAMLCDTPSNYLEDTLCTRFMTDIPTVFEHTEVLSAEIGNHIVTAREANGKWYVGALTNWNSRNLTISFPFMEKGKKYAVKMIIDKETSDILPSAYDLKELVLEAGAEMELKLAQGGGAAMIIEEI